MKDLETLLTKVEIMSKNINHLDNNKVNKILFENFNIDTNDKKTLEKHKKLLISIIKLKTKIQKNNNNQEELIKSIIDNQVDISFLDTIFERIPKLMVIKDSNHDSLFKNMMKQCLESIEKEDTEKYDYYKDIMKMMLSKRDFDLTIKEYEEINKDILSYTNHVLYMEKTTHLNEKLNMIFKLENIINLQSDKKVTIKELIKMNEMNFYYSKKIKNIPYNKIDIKNYPDRKQITDCVITIDKKDVLEIDDALSCKKLANGNYLLGVHIASILGYFDYDSEIVQNALKNLNTLRVMKDYTSKDINVLSMFPDWFFIDKASLSANNNRLTRSYQFEIDKKGNILHQEFFKSIINSNKQMSYEEVNDILQYNSYKTEIEKTICHLKEVSSVLIKNNETITSDKMVNLFMNLTGSNVAEFFYKNHYPCLYKVFKKKDNSIENITPLLEAVINNCDEKDSKTIYDIMRESVKMKAAYDLEGTSQIPFIEHYCTCTSPLRRASDIVIEHALEVCNDKKPTAKDLKTLKEDLIKNRDLFNQSEERINWFKGTYYKSLYHNKIYNIK